MVSELAHMKQYQKGLTVKQLIKELSKLPQNKPFYVYSDEEGNTCFKGYFIENYNDSVVIAGLTGLELEE